MSRPRLEIDDLGYAFDFTDSEKRWLKKLMSRHGVGLNGALEIIVRESISKMIKDGEEASYFCAYFKYDNHREVFFGIVSGDYIEVSMSDNGDWQLKVWRSREESKTQQPFFHRDGFEKIRDAYKHVDLYMGSYRSEAGIEEEE